MPGAHIDFGYIGQILLIVAALYAISAFSSYLQQYIMAAVAQRTVFVMRRDVEEKLARLPLKFFDGRTHGEILSRVTNDVDNISTTLQQQLIEQQSFTDPLTEIYNRRSLDEIAGRFISHARRLGNPLTFLMIDVNNFKQVNTRFGHLTGDTVLAEFAGLLKACIRGSDAAIRYGGDEFLIMLADTTASGSEKVIERITKQLADWNMAGHLRGFQLGASIGIAEWHDGEGLDEVLDAADRKMYRQKTLHSEPASFDLIER